MKRLFIAVNIPAQLRKEIFNLFSSKIPKNKGFKIVEESNLHFTLKFLGNFPEQKIPELIEKLKALQDEKPFSIAIQGIGCFKNRVLWLGVSKGIVELQKLNFKINSLLELQPETFQTHLTIARSKNASRVELKKVLEELNKEKQVFSFNAESIDLMHSELSPKGSSYSLVSSFQFSTLIQA